MTLYEGSVVVTLVPPPRRTLPVGHVAVAVTSVPKGAPVLKDRFGEAPIAGIATTSATMSEVIRTVFRDVRRSIGVFVVSR